MLFKVRFQPYFEMPSLFSAVKLIFFGLIFSLFAKFKLGIQCLLKVIHFIDLDHFNFIRRFSFQVYFQLDS
jgi:hypothetical protein